MKNYALQMGKAGVGEGSALSGTSSVFNLGTSNLSFSMWVNTNGAGDFQPFKIFNSTESRSYIEVSLNAGVMTITYNIFFTGATYGHLTIGPYEGDGVIIDSLWHHIVFTFNRTTATSTVYVDGVSYSPIDVPSNLNSVISILCDKMRLAVGWSNDTKIPAIADLRIFKNKILSQGEVTAIYTAVHPFYTEDGDEGGAATIVFPFNEGSGNPKSLVPSGGSQLTLTTTNCEWSSFNVPWQYTPTFTPVAAVGLDEFSADGSSTDSNIIGNTMGYIV